MKNYFQPHSNGVVVPSTIGDGGLQIIKEPPETINQHNHHLHHQRPLNPKAPARLNYIPIASAVALLISWLGLIFFCTKMHYGIGSIMDIAEQLFANLVPYLKNAQLAFVLLGVIMGLTTLAMAVIGACSTVNCRHFDCTGHQAPSAWSRRLGSRWVCGTFVALNHLLHICWLGILSFLVGLLAVYLGFSPVCIHKSGALDGSMCFNFSSFTALLAGSNNHDNMVNLVICGQPISQFCKLTHSILPWYGWAYFGCICVILGLTNFNSCLAANFAHCLRHSTSSLKQSNDVVPRHNQEWCNSSDGTRVLLLDSSGSSSRRTASPSSVIYGDFGGGFHPPPKYNLATDGISNQLMVSSLTNGLKEGREDREIYSGQFGIFRENEKNNNYCEGVGRVSEGSTHSPCESEQFPPLFDDHNGIGAKKTKIESHV